MFRFFVAAVSLLSLLSIPSTALARKPFGSPWSENEVLAVVACTEHGRYKPGTEAFYLCKQCEHKFFSDTDRCAESKCLLSNGLLKNDCAMQCLEDGTKVIKVCLANISL